MQPLDEQILKFSIIEEFPGVDGIDCRSLLQVGVGRRVLFGLFEDEFVGFAEACSEALVYQVDDGWKGATEQRK
ncbi:MAG TPA: hypothetical protein VGP62_19180 [Bryobacteraceae bacterium]|nr:hypothetical protein [Bryobacteraceae bacterium]